jgi:propionyl-CoA synthetase
MKKLIVLNNRLVRTGLISRFYSTSWPKCAGQSNYQKEYDESINNRVKYWGSKVDLLEWFDKPRSILDTSKTPLDEWYCSGKTNAAYNCLEVNVRNGLGDQVAIIHDSPMTSVIEKITYKQLLDEACLFSSSSSLKLS